MAGPKFFRRNNFHGDHANTKPKWHKVKWMPSPDVFVAECGYRRKNSIFEDDIKVSVLQKGYPKDGNLLCKDCFPDETRRLERRKELSDLRNPPPDDLFRKEFQ